MKALRVLNPKIVEDERFKAIEAKAVATTFGQYEGVPVHWIENPDNYGVFIAYEGPEIKGLSGIMLDSIPQWVLFAADSSEAKRALVSMGVDFLKDNGYTRFVAANTSGAADSVWKRAFWRKGEAKKIATIMEFTL